MGVKEICRFFSHRLFEAFVVVVLILFLPNLPPYTSFSEQPRLPLTKPLEGKLALNEKLNDVELWHKGDLIGPEAFADFNGELYVALYGGDVVKLHGNHVTPIVKTGKPCKDYYEERICGRPLGMQFDKTGALYVADAYYGIFKVDVKTGKKQLVVSVDREIEGKKPKIPNSIVLASNGDIYWSDSSSEFYLENGIFDLLADPSGRLIHYDAKTKKNKVLIDKLHFANGVALSDDEEFVIVAETFRNCIHRYYLKGPKRGTHDIFIDGLPGIPDNLKSDGKGGFFAPLLIAVDADHPFPSQVIGSFPLLRKLVARVLGLTELLFETLNKLYPFDFAQRAIHFIGHFTSFGTIISPARVTIIHIDKSGNIVDSLHGLNKKIGQICEIHIFKDTVYLGSPFNDYIAKVPLSKIGWDHLKLERKRRDAPEIITQAPTTTQNPTTTRSPTTTTIPPTTTTTTARPTTTSTTAPPPTTTTRAPTSTITSTQAAPPSSKQVPPAGEPAKQFTPSPTKQAPPPPTKQAPPPPTKQAPATPTKQAPAPPTKQTPASPTKQAPAPQPEQSPSPSQQTKPKTPSQQDLPSKQQTVSPQKQVPPPAQKPTTIKQSPPPVAQPMRDQTKTIPSKDSTKTTK